MFRLSVLVVVMVFGSVTAGVAAEEGSSSADEVFEPVAGDQRVASPAASNGGSIVARFDPGAGEFPEGVAVAPDGAVYASLSTLGQLVRIVPDGGYEVAGTVAGLQDGDPGLLGLAASADGSVYGAVVSANADARGVWRFDVETGAAERLPGTEAITFPNAIAIDSGGGLYVTDALGAAVWRVGPDGLAAIWVQGDLLAGAELPGVDFPIGANGIALDEDAGMVYVAVSTQGTVVEIPMLDDGLAGEPAMHTAFTNDQGMVGVDGVALDGRGNLYVAQPVANVVVRVAPDGTVEPVATVADGLDGPTSVAVGTGAGGIERLYIASWSDALGDLAPPDGGGPTVVMVPLDSAGHGRPAPGDW
jgi:sugar lactone lactonase YvrE